MKELTSPLRLIPGALGLALCFGATNAKALTSYFDANGTTAGDGTTAGGTYSWDASVWAASNTGTAATSTWSPTYDSAFAWFRHDTVSYTVNVGAVENMAGMYWNNSATATLTIGDAGGALNIVTVGGDAVNNLDGSYYQGFLASYWSSASAIALNSVVSGPGGIEQEGYGSIYLNNHNTYSGGTETTGGQQTYFQYGDSFGTGHIVINGGGQALINNSGGTVTLANPINFVTAGDALILANAPGGSTKFSGTQTLKIGANGVNNEFKGNSAGGSMEFDGTFALDLSGAADVAGNQWQIVDPTTMNASYGFAFAVDGFAQNGDIWTSGDYQFDQTTGVLMVVPEPSTAALFGLMGGLGLVFRRRRAA